MYHQSPDTEQCEEIYFYPSLSLGLNKEICFETQRSETCACKILELISFLGSKLNYLGRLGSGTLKKPASINDDFRRNLNFTLMYGIWYLDGVVSCLRH